MVMVHLHTLWLNVAANPSTRQRFPMMSALQVTTSQTGDVRRYASGRLRSVRQAGKTRAISATLPSCSREQIAWLEKYQGETLCIRDDRGRKLWGVYYSLPVDEHHYNIEGDVSLALSEVSKVEGIF